MGKRAIRIKLARMVRRRAGYITHVEGVYLAVELVDAHTLCCLAPFVAVLPHELRLLDIELAGAEEAAAFGAGAVASVSISVGRQPWGGGCESQGLGMHVRRMRDSQERAVIGAY